MVKKASSGKQLRVLLLENIHRQAVDMLSSEGYEVETLSHALNEEELIARIPSVDILGIRSNTNITANVLSAAKRLVTVGCFCIGTNQVDLAGASAQGVAVFNAPYSNTRSVAELVIGEIIALSRHLIDKNNKTHQGVWDKSAEGCHEVRGLKLGIVGYGNIGSQLSVLAESLGMEVAYFDIADKLSMGNTRRADSLQDLLRTSDVVSVHVDGQPTNKLLIDEAAFAAMRPGVLFLNLSRGMIVDLASLKKHLLSGHVAGAAIDVYPLEPKAKGEAFQSELRGIPNVILTPHIASGTEEAQTDIGRFVATKLVKYVNEGNTMLSVNLPQMSLQANQNFHRVLLIHHNIPGVLAQINGCIAEGGGNINAQRLATSGEYGCLLTDIGGDQVSKVTQRLRGLPETIRLREL